jgi:hypothetical protein
MNRGGEMARRNANRILARWPPKSVATKSARVFSRSAHKAVKIPEVPRTKIILAITDDDYKRLEHFAQFTESKNDVCFEIRRYSFWLQSECRPTDRLLMCE